MSTATALYWLSVLTNFKEIVEYCDQLQEINNTRLEVIRTPPPIIVEIPEASK